MAATSARSRPCAARIDAAPSVGPTQGLHTAPNSSPTAVLARETTRSRATKVPIAPVRKRRAGKREPRKRLSRRASVAQSVMFNSAAIDEGSVSPTERPVSVAPLNVISVDCMRAPKYFTASF